MSLFSFKIKIADLVAAIAILSVLALALYFAFDPKEANNKKYDSMYSPTAGAIANLISDHFKKLETPYTKSIGYAPAGMVLKDLGLYDAFVDDKFKLESIDNFYIGKKEGADASVYVCFAPKSKFTRDSRCSDSFVYTLNRDGTKVTINCDVNSTWQTENSPWMICSPR